MWPAFRISRVCTTGTWYMWVADRSWLLILQRPIKGFVEPPPEHVVLTRAPELFREPISIIFGVLESWEVQFFDPDFSGLFHVSIVEFQVDLCKKVGFACVISELGGGLPDLGWFLFFHHSKDECQARFYGYQTPVGGTGTPLNDLWFEEVMGKKPDFGSVEFCLGGYRARGWTSRPRMIFIFLSIWKMSVRRVFIATKLRWGVPGSLSTNHELKRSWCGKTALRWLVILKLFWPHHDLFNSWFVERDPGTPHRSLVAIKTRLTLIFQMVKK